MRQWLSKSLKRKLSLLLLVAIIFPLLATGVVSYVIASSVTEEKEKLTGLNTLREIADKLDFIVEDVENMSLFLIGQSDIQTYLDQDTQDISRFSLNIGFLTNLAFSKTYIANITITSSKGHPPLSNTAILRTPLPELLEQHGDVYEAKPKWWSPTYEVMTSDGLKRVISLVRPVRSIDHYQTLGLLAISIDEAQIRKSLADANWEERGAILLLDHNDVVLSSENPQWLGASIQDVLPGLTLGPSHSGTSNHMAGKTRNTVLHYTLPNHGWKLVGVIPTEIYTSQNKYVLMVTAIAIGASLVFAFGLVLLFIHWVTKPLTNLAQTMKNVNPDEKIPAFPIRSQDEVGLLFHSFNKLSHRIMRLKEQVQLNEAMKKEADMLALQAQIHPHFLYNTLSSIHWLSLMSKEKRIADMVGSLSNFLRLSLNKGKDFCTVQQEIAHAQSYAHIMSIRFQDQFQITFDIEPELHPYPVLKLLLQPLIENSIMHGVDRTSGRIQVFVHGKRLSDAMMFVVEDTGLGMTENKLQTIRDMLDETTSRLMNSAQTPPKVQTTNVLKEHAKEEELDRGSEYSPFAGSGYGLRSVHQRLQLHYGNRAGLKIESHKLAGTRISFTIPIVGDGHENHDRRR